MLRKITFEFLHPLWRLTDFCVPKKKNYWAFATHHLHADRFIENQRAVFEHVKNDPSIYKIIFYRGGKPELSIERACNYIVVRHGSFRGLALLAQCNVIFLTHSVCMDYSLRWGDGRFSILKLFSHSRTIVNLWHGIPLKRLLYTANDTVFRHTDRIKYRAKERRGYAGLIASSDIDSYAMSAMFYPLNYRQVWTTGLPRNDFLTIEEGRLPAYIEDSIKKIRALRKDKRLIVYAPTYRQTEINKGSYYYQFSENEIINLKRFLQENNAVLGYRPHYFKNSSKYFNLDQYVDNELIFDMSQQAIPEYSALARELNLLVTDYSSVYIEALFLGKPVICFGYDIDNYMQNEDGLLYSMPLAFPGPVVKDFSSLLSALALRINTSASDIYEEQRVARDIFFKYGDGRNSERVVRQVRIAQGGSSGACGANFG